MNYSKIYESIIQNAKSKNRVKTKIDSENYIYYENHHILPKCLGGNNDKENLVLLTAKEHFVCHKLLTYIYKGNKKLVNAYCRMTWDKVGNRKITSRDYAYARELKASIPVSEETKQKMRKPKGPMSNEHRLNIGKAGKGRKRSENSKEKQRKSISGKKKPWLIGKIPWNKGISYSEELREKISKAGKGISRNKGHIMSEEQKEHLRIINTGKKQSKETIEKRKRSVGIPWNKGLRKNKMGEYVKK